MRIERETLPANARGDQVMTTRTALFALLAMWGVGLGGAMPLRADDAVSGETKTAASAGPTTPDSGLTNRVC